jgi:hypothetical protein
MIVMKGTATITRAFPCVAACGRVTAAAARVLPEPVGAASPYTDRRNRRRPVLEPVMGSRFDLAGLGRAQPGINFGALLLRRLDDVLLGPAAGLVPPELAIRSEGLAEGRCASGPRQTPAVPVV